MGCSQSRERTKPQKEEEVYPSVVYKKELTTDQGDSTNRLQIDVSSGGWVADEHFGDYVKVIEQPDQTIFAFLFDPHGGRDAAEFCTKHCHGAFEAAMEGCDSDPSKALSKAIVDLDEMFLSSKLPPQVKQSTGCSGVLAFVDLDSRRCWTAHIGSSRCLVGFSEGAFNARRMDGRPVCPSPRSRGLGGPLSSADDERGADGCIGFGASKKRTLPLLGSTREQISARAPEVVESDMTGAEKLVLYSEGMSKLLSVPDIAIFAMHFEKSNLNDLKRHYYDQADTLQPAEALIRHAVARAGENLSDFITKHDLANKSMKEKAKFTNVEDMRTLKMNSGTGIRRRDFHQNLSCLVVSLQSAETTRRVFSFSRTGCTLQNRAMYRWKLVQLFCKFQIQKRRTILRRWWDLISLSVRESQLKQLRDEKENWLKSTGSSYDQAPTKFGHGFRTWLHNSSMKGTLNDAECAAKTITL